MSWRLVDLLTLLKVGGRGFLDAAIGVGSWVALRVLIRPPPNRGTLGFLREVSGSYLSYFSYTILSFKRPSADIFIRGFVV